MISVIIPIYNVSKYLVKCIGSVCAQTYRDLEIILVDDGSTDGCAKICDSFAEKDSRIVVIHKENGGLVSARKAGIKRATGRYIGYVDGDDWIEPDMYEKLYACITEKDADIAMCGRYEDTENFSKSVYHSIEEGYYNKQKMLTEIYPRMIVDGDFYSWGILAGVWDKLFKKECLERFQMEVDEKIVMGEDAACVYPCLLNADSIYILHECLYHYRQTTSSMSKQSADCELERNRFSVMYQSVKDKFTHYSAIFDLRKQWEEYVLFLMFQRADILYKGYSRLDYLFPFSKIKKGSRIVLYGAGTYGQRLYRYLKTTGFCEVVIWADRNYTELRKSGLDVKSPEEIGFKQFDYIAVAISYAAPRMSACKELSARYGADKVSLIDVKLIKSEESKRAFGIIS